MPRSRHKTKQDTHKMLGRHHHHSKARSDEEPMSPVSRVDTAGTAGTAGTAERGGNNDDREVHITIDPESARFYGEDNSDAMSTGSARRAAFRRRGKRMTASRSYQNPTKIIGAEPGVEATQEVDLDLYASCEITLVDYGMEDMITTELVNETLPEFLARPRPRWATVRWINVNGLSWDVIKCLGQYKALHRLAIEDIMNTRSRTKTDWYSDHALIILTLQKLVHLHAPEEEVKTSRGWWQRAFDIPAPLDSDDDESIPDVKGHTPGSEVQSVQTLQRYHGGPNYERILYMERNSSLAQKGYAVSVEQCSIFLCDDNTVISFFERSADDIEPPIMARLRSTNTLLRSSCDGSMVVQAIIDAIVDLAFPVVHAYQDTLGELELNVLSDTSLHDTHRLYVLTSELALLKTTISPLMGVINALRDHKREVGKYKGAHNSIHNLTSVGISPITHTYLGDVQDHCLVLLDTVETMKRSADNLTDYIFNTVGNLQNENMRQLTIVTIFFLPLTFLTGYFGMNFEEFGGIKNSDSYFWYIAVPIAVTTIIALMNGPIIRQISKGVRRRQIRKVRAIRKKRENAERPRIRLAAAKRLTFGIKDGVGERSNTIYQANGDIGVLHEESSGNTEFSREGTGKIDENGEDGGSDRIRIEP